MIGKDHGHLLIKSAQHSLPPSFSSYKLPGLALLYCHNFGRVHTENETWADFSLGWAIFANGVL